MAAGATPRVEWVAGPAHADPALPHLLLAVDGLARTLGGGERVLLRLARLLPAYGFRVSILTLALDPASPALENPPCPIYLLPLRRTYDLHALRAAAVLRQFLRQERVRLTQTFFESSDLWVGPVARSAGSALIWSRRDLGILRGRKHRMAYRLLRRLPDRVFAVSEQVRRHVIEVDGVAPERVLTVYNGIDVPTDAAVLAGEPGRLHITAVGNVRPVKGFDLLVEAAAEVVGKYPAARFTVAGEILDAEYHAVLQRRIAELGLADRFLFLGEVRAVAEHLRTADIFCLPSRSEGLSNALLEGMAAGLPAVATDVGGNAECIEDGISGRIVPPGDAPAIGRALLELAADGTLRQQMGARALERVGYLFSTKAMLDRSVTAYRAVLAGENAAELP